MSNNNVPKDLKTPQGKEYAKGMSGFFGQDVSNSEPVLNYDKAAMNRRVGKPKSQKRKH